MITRREKSDRAVVYGALCAACAATLFAALALPDGLEGSEAQVATIYLTLLLGSKQAFNASAIRGIRLLGPAATLMGTGVVPASILHMALFRQPRTKTYT